VYINDLRTWGSAYSQIGCNNWTSHPTSLRCGSYRYVLKHVLRLEYGDSEGHENSKLRKI